MKIKSILVVVLVLLYFASTGFAAAPSFQGLGDLSGGDFFSEALGVSADGSVVVGASISDLSMQAFRWTQSAGMINLGDLPGGNSFSMAYDISDNGSIIVGRSVGSNGCESCIWENGVIRHIAYDIDDTEYAYAISADGSTVVGYGYFFPGGSHWQGYVWKDGTTTQLGTIGNAGSPNNWLSVAYDLSADGTIVVGEAMSAQGHQAFHWTQTNGIAGIGDLTGGVFFSSARAISANGNAIVGVSDSDIGLEAFRWEQDTMVGLGVLAEDIPPELVEYSSIAYDVSADGSVIVGQSYEKAFVWDQVYGMRDLQIVLENDLGLDLTEWQLLSANAISSDGTVIVGVGINHDGYMEGWIATIPEPSTPPVAHADGPYTIYVDDPLTLDANGSTDNDNDIVSYMWDLDDNNSFETNAGSQAIFDVNYTYLLSLGLVVDNTYNIHLKVTDSKGQSDTADSTLTIIPQPALEVAVDIKPGSCPNPLNVKSSGVLPVAILGTEEFDVNEIDATSIQLAGISAIRHSFEDVATPVVDCNDCNCTEDGPDGFLDLTLKFKTQEIVNSIGDVDDGDVLALELTGVLYGERPIEGQDCVVVRGKARSLHGADINGDGKVDIVDFALFADNWLETSIAYD